MYADLAHTHRRGRANAPVWIGVVFVLAAIAVLIRIGLPSHLVDLYVNYTLDTGSMPEKIHPGSYAIAGVFGLALATLRIRFDPWEYRAAIALSVFAAVMLILMSYLALFGRAAAAGYLIDTYVTGVMIGLVLLAIPRNLRVACGSLVMMLVMVSALIAITEFGLRVRILPFPIAEEIFRPTGLAGHPLTLGLLSATGILFVMCQPWRPGWKTTAIIILFVGVAAANARIATLAAALAIAGTVLLAPMPAPSQARQLGLKGLIVIAGFIALIAGASVLAMGGFFTRIGGGFIDNSAMARVEVYQLFAITGWNEILFGTDVTRIAKLAETQLGLLAIESSIVVFIFQFGLFGALLFGGTLLWMLTRLLHGAPPSAIAATCLFVAVALTNNTLSTKTPVIVILVVLIIAAQAAAQSMPAHEIVRRR